MVLRSESIAGRSVRNVPAADDPDHAATQANVGARLLRALVIVTGFPHGALWLQPR